MDEAKKQLIIGLTGPIAAGKNLAGDILSKLGCSVVDADKLVHQAIEKVKPSILEYFLPLAQKEGISILKADGTIDRRELGKLVFANKINLTKQESIVHPAVDLLMEEFIKENYPSPAVLNATVLYKSTLISRCDFILFVTAPIRIRYKRVKARDNLPPIEIIKRFLAQRKIFSKYKKLNVDIYKVDNSGNPEKLQDQIEKIFQFYLGSKG
jgi:dephospho-CoA kinase